MKWGLPSRAALGRRGLRLDRRWAGLACRGRTRRGSGRTTVGRPSCRAGCCRRGLRRADRGRVHPAGRSRLRRRRERGTALRRRGSSGRWGAEPGTGLRGRGGSRAWAVLHARGCNRAWTAHRSLGRWRDPRVTATGSSHGRRAAHRLLLRRRSVATVGVGPRGRVARQRTPIGWAWRGAALSVPLLTRGTALVGADVLPASLVVVPVASLVLPASIHDHVRRFDVEVSRLLVLPVPGHPCPTVTIPVPVAANPVMVRAGRHGDEFLLRRRWGAGDEHGLFLDDHGRGGLRLRRVVDRLWRRRSHRDGGPDHAARDSRGEKCESEKPGCGSGHDFLPEVWTY